MPNLDFLIENYALGKICSIVLFITLLVNYKHMYYNHAKGGTGYIYLFCVMVFYSLFYVKGDVGDIYTSMFNYYNYLSGTDAEQLHFEPIYFRIMDLVSFGYVYWRFVVWGSAAAIMLFVIKKMGCDIHLATIFMCYFCLPLAFYYQRVSLGFALLLLGLYYFLKWKENSNKIALVLAVSLFLLCTLFHRSMFLYLIVLFISVYIPISKKNWFLFLILIPFLVSSLNSLVTFLVGQSEELYELSEFYVDASKQHAKKNFGGIVVEILEWGPYICMMFYALYNYIKRPNLFTLTQRTLLLFGVMLYTTSVILSGRTSDAFLGKMQVQSLFPMTLFFTLFFKDRRHKTESRIFMTALSVSYVLQLMYSGF